MAQQLTNSQRNAMDYLYGGNMDESIEWQTMAWVRTRFSHKCPSLLHKGGRMIPAGSWMVMERAKVDGTCASCWTCRDCVKAAQKELRCR